MPFGYRTGVFKSCLTQQRCVFHFEKRRRQVCKWISEDSLEEKLRRKDSLFTERLSCCCWVFFFYWHVWLVKKKQIYCVVWPSLFWSFHWSKTSTKHKWTIKLTFKRDPVKTTRVPPRWRNNSTGQQTVSPPLRNMKNTHQMPCFHDAPLWSRNSQFERIINEVLPRGTWKVGWYGWKQPNLPCSLALLARWCDCCSSLTAAVYMPFFFFFLKIII